jgi:putative endonuclease
MYYVYVLRSLKDGRFYTGQTQDLKTRLELHNSGKMKYTGKFTPWELVYFETFDSRSEAMQRERFFKTGAGRDWLNRKLNEQNHPSEFKLE